MTSALRIPWAWLLSATASGRHRVATLNGLHYHHSLPSTPQPLVCRKFSTNPPKEPTTNIDEFRQREEQREQLAEASTDTRKTADDKAARITAIRESILNAALPFVGQHGWSRAAIEHGATSINYPGIVHGLFPAGGIELIQHFALVCDRKLIEQLRTKLPLAKATENAVEVLLPEFAFVADAIRMRLEMLEPMRDQWTQAMAVRALPTNAGPAIEQTLRMIDDICYLAGDRSTDIKWYTRRMAVATLYKVTELHWLQDRSPGQQDTWAFLQRRIQELNQLQSIVGGDGSTIESLTGVIRTVFDTTRNMVGAPFGRT